MKLDRTTYEAWLLDRIEGNLTPAQEQELDAFLASNADLNADVGELPAITDGGKGFAWKDELKKHYPPTGEPDLARIDDFLIARMEGALDAARVKQLERLLYEQPALQRNAQLIAATKSGTTTVLFQDKSSIARHFPPPGMPDMHRLDDFLVARSEGDLTLQQRVALDALIAQDERAAKQWAVMQSARVPKERIVFADKEQLKKRPVRVVPIGGSAWMKLAAAASIALLLGLGWLLLRGEEQVPVVADQQETPSAKGQPNSADTDPAVKQPETQAHNLDGEQEVGTAPAKEPSPVKEHEEQPVIDRPQPPAPVPSQREQAPALAQSRPAPLERNEQERTPAVALETLGTLPTGEGAVADATHAAEHRTIGEFLTGTLRTEVLGEAAAPERTLNGNDAVAAIDKSLGAITGDRAGVAYANDAKRSRFRLHLGDLALSASRGR